MEPKIAEAQRKMEWIKEMLASGRKVIVCTYTRGFLMSRLDQFKMDSKGSLYIQRGRNWDCIDYCGLRAQ